jgi:hypothetical protein
MKKMVIRNFLMVFTFIILKHSFAQNDIDALRYSRIGFSGTARFSGMGGSMGALGGDVSTMSFNPAGIGIFRKSEFTLSPSILIASTNSVFGNEENLDLKANVNLSNFGLVIAIKTKESNKSGWEMINLGFGYNRINNFQNRILTQGYNKSSSLLDAFVAEANSVGRNNFDPFSTELAYQSYLINPKLNDTSHYNHIIPNYGELQRNSVTTKGSMGDWFFAFGGNYKNKLYVGGSVNIVSAKYIEDVTYEEIDEADSIKNFKSFALSKSLTSKGTGVNLKLGLIYRVTDWLRLGAAIHTPTAISMTDSYSSSIKTDLESGGTYSNTSPLGNFNYSVITPMRAIGSMGIIVNRIALLNVDYEVVDYSSAVLRSKPNVFGSVNQTIRGKYTLANNIRVGGELRFQPIAVRLGYGYYGSPYKNGENKNAVSNSYTFGLGYRKDLFFVDGAFVLNKLSEYSYMYDSNFVNPAKNNYTVATWMFTIGTKF